MTDDSHEMVMVFAFEDASPSFVNGFEAGAIWQEIDGEGKLEIDRGYETGFPIHTANIEVVRRMAAVRHYRVETKATDYGEWTAVRLTYVGDRGKPSLKVVS